ncbi:MAG TPA: response regulator transcription factor [Terriglobales bacterium]|nr:response regulator transcription factor [Terriglobales bacterium]
MPGVRILVADDHEVVRKGVCALLGSHPGWEVCCEVADGRQAVEKTAEMKPDIVILDIGMPRLNGLEAARQILRADPRQRILVLTISDAEQMVQEVLKAGARGFLLKSDAAKEVVSAVDALLHDRTYFNSRVGEMVLTRFLHRGNAPEGDYGLPALTPREREVLQLLAEGQTTKEVAATLHLSVKTAETHRSNLMRKLGLHNVSELVMYAVRNNIISVGEHRAIA